MDKIRILLADDHAIVREGLRMLLNAEPEMEVIGEAANGSQVLDLARRLTPDLVLMDISMPGMNGIEATRMIKTTLPQIQILALTMQESEDYFFQILVAGASGYVVKGATSVELLSAIRSVHQGGVYLSPTLAKKLVSDFLKTQGAAPGAVDSLTAREQLVLKLIAAGKTNREIAEELVLSLNTIQTHRLHLMKKLNLHNRAELIKYAMQRGLIESR